MYPFATLLARKGLFALSTESLTLTEGVCSKVRVYLQGAMKESEKQVSDLLHLSL